MIRSGRPTWGRGDSAYHKINCAYDDKSIFSSYILVWRLETISNFLPLKTKHGPVNNILKETWPQIQRVTIYIQHPNNGKNTALC